MVSNGVTLRISKLKIVYVLCLVAVLFILGCGNSGNVEANITGELKLKSSPVVIKTKIIRSGEFYSSLLSNGKLEAVLMTNLVFERNGVVNGVFVKNGDRVGEGTLLAHQDTTILHAELVKANHSLSKAILDMEHLLLDLGFNIEDSLNIPPKVLRTAYLVSGIRDRQSQVVIAKRNLSSAKMRAPFNGVIAGLSLKEHNTTSSAEGVCTLIAEDELWVNFYILERELYQISINDEVEFTPVAFQNSKKFLGFVKSINPKVEENGLILVKALVQNVDHKLIDGMNVSIVVKQYKSNVIVVDKSTVLERNGRKVVFTFESGLAKWNYVALGIESADSVEITSGLRAGDQIIIEGQINLGHNAPVELGK